VIKGIKADKNETMEMRRLFLILDAFFGFSVFA